MPSFTLGKQERLSSKKQIEQLFREGKSFHMPPFRMTWYLDGPVNGIPFQVMFSVSKRSFPNAVDRNRIRRLMRESFRLHKAPLAEFLQLNDQRCLIAIIFVGKEIPGYHQAEPKIIAALQRLIREIEHKRSGASQ